MEQQVGKETDEAFIEKRKTALRKGDQAKKDDQALNGRNITKPIVAKELNWKQLDQSFANRRIPIEVSFFY